MTTMDADRRVAAKMRRNALVLLPVPVLAGLALLVLVGDPRQLSEIQAGGTCRALVQRGLASELRANVRPHGCSARRSTRWARC